MTDSSTRADANNCFVCGPDNPAGLRVSFRLDGELCKAEYTPDVHHCGYDDVTHGGIIFSLLDDVMANWFFLRGERAYTGRCEIRFRAPVTAGTPLLLEARLLSRKGRIAKMHGQALNEAGQTIAEATATFAVMPDT